VPVIVPGVERVEVAPAQGLVAEGLQQVRGLGGEHGEARGGRVRGAQVRRHGGHEQGRELLSAHRVGPRRREQPGVCEGREGRVHLRVELYATVHQLWRREVGGAVPREEHRARDAAEGVEREAKRVLAVVCKRGHRPEMVNRVNLPQQEVHIAVVEQGIGVGHRRGTRVYAASCLCHPRAAMSPEVRWVVQNNLGSADDIVRLCDTLDRQGVAWTPLRVIPFDDTPPDVPAEGP
jgi:hypothetical protein